MRLSSPRRRALVLGASLAAVAVALPAPAASAATVVAPPSSSWTPWKACSSGTATDNCAEVRALLRTSDGGIVLGGDFDELRSPDGASSVPAVDLAALDATGSPRDGFARHTTDGEVYALAADRYGLYVGGAFRTFDGATTGSLVRLDPTSGARQSSFAGDVVGTVMTVAPAGDAVYLGGTVQGVQNTPRTGLAKLRGADGVLDGAWTPSATIDKSAAYPNDFPAHNNTPVRSIAVTPDLRRVYVAGDFDAIDGADQSALAAVNSTSGALVPDFDSHLDTKYQGMDVVLPSPTTTGTPGGVVLAGGGTINRGFRFREDGTQQWQIRTDGDVQAAAVDGTTIYFGGHFEHICRTTCFDSDTSDDVARLHLAALPDSTSMPVPDPTWSPSLGPTFSPYYYGVWSLLAAGGNVYAGGVFRNVASGGTTYAHPKYAAFAGVRASNPPAGPVSVQVSSRTCTTASGTATTRTDDATGTVSIDGLGSGKVSFGTKDSSGTRSGSFTVPAPAAVPSGSRAFTVTGTSSGTPTGVVGTGSTAVPVGPCTPHDLLALTGTDAHLYAKSTATDATFSNLAGSLKDAPALVSSGGTTYYVGVASADSTLYVRTASRSWQRLTPSTTTCSGPSAGVYGGQFYVACTSSTGRVLISHAALPAGGALPVLPTPVDHGGSVTQGTTMTTAGGVRVQVVGTNHKVYETSPDRASGSYSVIFSDLLCYGRAEVAADHTAACAGSSGDLQVPTTSGGHTTIKSVFAGKPTFSVDPDGTTRYYVLGTDHLIYAAGRSASGTLSGFHKYGGSGSYGISAVQEPR